MTTTKVSNTPLYDAVVQATGIDPKVRVPAPVIPPLTKRQRHKFAPLAEAVLVRAGLAAKADK